MAKINGSEAKIGIRIGSTHGTAVDVAGAYGIAFDSLEWNDNPEQLEFSSKGLGRSMKSYLQQGRMTPNLTLNYKLKYGGVGMELLAGFLGADDTPTEQNAGQGDYARTISYGSTSKFYTIAVQSSSSTSIEWASCYPSSATLTFNSFQPVEVSINFVTTPRENSPSTNTYANLNSTTISDDGDSWLVFTQASKFAFNNLGAGSMPSSHSDDVQSITLDLQKNHEVTNEVTGSATTGAPNRVGLFTCTMQSTHAGLEDHTYMTTYENETAKQVNIELTGSQIGSGANERLSFYLPAVKMVADVGAPIVNDGFNPVTLSWESYIDSSSDGAHDEPYIYIINQDSASYV